MRIGEHNVKLLETGVESLGPFGANRVALIELDGKTYKALRQGMIGIWAFRVRPSLSSEDCVALDDYLDTEAGGAL